MTWYKPRGRKERPGADAGRKEEAPRTTEPWARLEFQDVQAKVWANPTPDGDCTYRWRLSRAGDWRSSYFSCRDFGAVAEVVRQVQLEIARDHWRKMLKK